MLAKNQAFLKLFSAHRSSVWSLLPQYCPEGPPCQISKQKYSLSAGFSNYTILISGNSSRLSQGASPGGPGPELLRGAPAGVHPDWGVIGLSHRLACFPMWATAAWRPRGTIWKQHDTLQCRGGLQCPGYREQARGSRKTKLQQRCLLALKRLPFGLLLTVSSIWKSDNWILVEAFFINVLLNSKGNEWESLSKGSQAPGWKLDFPDVLQWNTQSRHQNDKTRISFFDLEQRVNSVSQNIYGSV